MGRGDAVTKVAVAMPFACLSASLWRMHGVPYLFLKFHLACLPPLQPIYLYGKFSFYTSEKSKNIWCDFSFDVGTVYHIDTEKEQGAKRVA